MPHAHARDGARLYYDRWDPRDRCQRRDPRVLLLLAPLGLTGGVYRRLVWQANESGYSVITYDSRGCGRSDDPRSRLSTATCADDVVAILDHAGVGRAHMSGASFGGMVGQEVALRSPGRVGALVLQSTSGGLPRLDLMRPGYLREVVAGALRGGVPIPHDAAVERIVRLLVSESYQRQLRPGAEDWETIRAELDAPRRPATKLALLWAALAHSTWSRLGRLAAPTQIQHGLADRIISPRAGRELVRRIPHAELHEFPGAGHALGFDSHDRSTKLGLRHLQRHDHLLTG